MRLDARAKAVAMERPLGYGGESSQGFRMNMMFELFSIMIAASFLAGCLALLAFGRRLGQRHIGNAGTGAMAGLDAVEGAVFALLGLLLAFAISGALQRFDERRQLIVQEAIAVGAAYDHLDLLQVGPRDALKGKLKEYLGARIELYNKPIGFDLEHERATYSQEQEATIAALKAELWSGTVSACPAASYVSTCSILLPIIARVFETAQLRRGANEKHPPKIVFAMLYGFGLVGSLLGGFSMASSKAPSRVHLLAFAIALSFALFVLTNVEFPRLGLIRVDFFDHFLSDVHSRMQ